jgi:hypothetical protein
MRPPAERYGVTMNEEDYRQRQRTNLLVLVIAAVLVVGTIALLLSLHRGLRQEDCFAASHRNCAPIEER